MIQRHPPVVNPPTTDKTSEKGWFILSGSKIMTPAYTRYAVVTLTELIPENTELVLNGKSVVWNKVDSEGKVLKFELDNFDPVKVTLRMNTEGKQVIEEMMLSK